jgi:hypothetical protein
MFNIDWKWRKGMTVTEITNDSFPLDLVQYCIESILKEARKEDRLVRQILYTMFSAYTNAPINLAINSPSGEGKTYVSTKVSEKFPEEDVVILSGMSQKALFHRPGILVVRNEDGKYVPVEDEIGRIDSEIRDYESGIETTRNLDLKKGMSSIIKDDLANKKKEVYKRAKKLIDLSHKIIIFLDTPLVELLVALMPLLSHDKYEVEYEYVDSQDGIETKSNVLRGWPTVIYAQAIDYTKSLRWPEIQRRFIITNPKMTKENIMKQ